MNKKTLKILTLIFLLLIVSFVNTKMVVLGYRDEPEDFGIDSSQRYSVMCVYVLFPIICELKGSQEVGKNYYLVDKEVYSYWIYLQKGSRILGEAPYYNRTFYCYNKNKKRKKIDKENYGIACSEEYKEIFRQ